VARMGEERKVYKVLVGKPGGKRPLGKPRRRWEDGIRMDLGEISWRGVDWIRMAQDRDLWRAVVSAVTNLRVPSTAASLVDFVRFSCIWDLLWLLPLLGLILQSNGRIGWPLRRRELATNRERQK
jgi:hypothetical protein